MRRRQDSIAPLCAAWRSARRSCPRRGHGRSRPASQSMTSQHSVLPRSPTAAACASLGWTWSERSSPASIYLISSGSARRLGRAGHFARELAQQFAEAAPAYGPLAIVLRPLGDPKAPSFRQTDPASGRFCRARAPGGRRPRTGERTESSAGIGIKAFMLIMR